MNRYVDYEAYRKLYMQYKSKEELVEYVAEAEKDELGSFSSPTFKRFLKFLKNNSGDLFQDDPEESKKA